jgi:hypothetical protein
MTEVTWSEFESENLRGRDDLEDLGIDGWTVIKSAAEHTVITFETTQINPPSPVLKNHAPFIDEEITVCSLEG